MSNPEESVPAATKVAAHTVNRNVRPFFMQGL